MKAVMIYPVDLGLTDESEAWQLLCKYLGHTSKQPCLILTEVVVFGGSGIPPVKRG